MRLIAFLLSALLLSSAAPAQTFRAANALPDVASDIKGVWYVSTSGTITDHGNAATVGSAAWCAAQAGAKTLEFPPGASYAFATNWTPTGMTLRIGNGATLEPAGGVTVDLSGVVVVAEAETWTGGAGTVVQGTVSVPNYSADLASTTKGADLVANVAKVYNVKSYGAVGDGATDDTTAVQNAVTAATTVGGIVFFPPGRYLTDGITITTGRVVLMGAWPGVRTASITDTIGAQLIHADGNAGPLIHLAGTAATYPDLTTINFVRAVGLENLSLVGGDQTTYLLSVENTEGWYFRNLFGRQTNLSGGGVRVFQSWEWTMENSRFVGPAAAGSATGKGLDVDNDFHTVNQYLIRNVDFYQWGYGQYFERTGGTGSGLIGAGTIIGGQVSNCDVAGTWLNTAVDGLTFLGHHFETNQGAGLHSVASKNVKLLGCTFSQNGQDTTSADIYISGVAENWDINGVTFFGLRQKGIEFTASDNIRHVTVDHLKFNPLVNGAGTGLYIPTGSTPNLSITIGNNIKWVGTNGNTLATTIDDAGAKFGYRRPIRTLTIASGTTADVTGYSAVNLAYGGAVSLTNIIGGVNGMILGVHASNNNGTLVHGAGGTGQFLLSGASNWTPSSGQGGKILQWWNGAWYEIPQN